MTSANATSNRLVSAVNKILASFTTQNQQKYRKVLVKTSFSIEILIYNTLSLRVSRFFVVLAYCCNTCFWHRAAYIMIYHALRRRLTV